MVTTAEYEIETSEADDGTAVPAEGIWTPSSEDAADNGFIAYGGLYVAGIGAPNDDGLYPDRFVVLGHQRWADIIEAAAAYMDRVHSWRTLQNGMNCIERNTLQLAVHRFVLVSASVMRLLRGHSKR